MAKKVEFFVDSGANIHSRRSEVIGLEEWGLDEGEWESMSDEEKQEQVSDWAWNTGLEWGWKDVD